MLLLHAIISCFAAEMLVSVISIPTYIYLVICFSCSTCVFIVHSYYVRHEPHPFLLSYTWTPHACVKHPCSINRKWLTTNKDFFHSCMYIDFVGQRSCTQEKGLNQGLYMYLVVSCLNWRRWKKSKLAVWLISVGHCNEGLSRYRNTQSVCNCHVWEFLDHFIWKNGCGVSVPSLHIVSTDSMIQYCTCHTC